MPEINRLIAAAASAYRTGDPRKPVPAESAMAPIGQELFWGVGSPFPDQDVSDPADVEKQPPLRACDLTVLFLRRISTLPPPRQVMVYRTCLRQMASQ